MYTKKLGAAALALTLAGGLAACGSSKSSTVSSATTAGASSSATSAGSSGGSGSSAVASAQSVVNKYLAAPTDIAETVPLPHAPAKGIKVAFLTCPEASCSLLNSGFTSAAQALGWDPTVITYSTATPGQALQQAINEGYKYIASTSVTLSEITPEVQEAKAKGIALFEGYVPDTPEGATNGLYGVVADQASSVAGGALMGDWIEANSQGHANVVYVDLPLYPSLVGEGQGAQQELNKLCPSCSFSTLPVTVNQLSAGQVPSAIVSYLQAHPSTNYVYLSFQDLDPGLVSALRTAGLLSKVKVIGTEGEAAQLQEVENGTETMWSVLPEPYEMWVIVDWMARQSEGVLNQAALNAGNAAEVFFVQTPAQAKAQLAADGGNWPGPANYEKDFKALWHV